MKKSITICDRCGREMNDGWAKRIFRVSHRPISVVMCDEYSFSNYEYDLCKSCFLEVMRFIRNVDREEKAGGGNDE